MAPKCTIDIFGDLNIAFTKEATGNGTKQLKSEDWV